MAKRQNKIIKVRRTWKINPKTKVKKSGKVYKRTKQKAVLKKILEEEELK